MGGPLGLLRKVATSALVSSLPLNRPIVLGAVALWALVQDRLSKKGTSKKRGKDGGGKESGVSDIMDPNDPNDDQTDLNNTFW